MTVPVYDNVPVCRQCQYRTMCQSVDSASMWQCASLYDCASLWSVSASGRWCSASGQKPILNCLSTLPPPTLLRCTGSVKNMLIVIQYIIQLMYMVLTVQVSLTLPRTDSVFFSRCSGVCIPQYIALGIVPASTVPRSWWYCPVLPSSRQGTSPSTTKAYKGYQP